MARASALIRDAISTEVSLRVPSESKTPSSTAVRKMRDAIKPLDRPSKWLAQLSAKVSLLMALRPPGRAQLSRWSRVVTSQHSPFGKGLNHALHIRPYVRSRRNVVCIDDLPRHLLDAVAAVAQFPHKPRYGVNNVD